MSYVVVGGGVGGLAAAFYLKQLPRTKSIIILESSSCLGGWIQTTRHSDGVRHEHGPRTVRPVGPQGANTLQLVEGLALQDKIIPISKSHPSALNRFVLVDGKLHKLPSDMVSVFKRLRPFRRPLALAAWQDLRTPAKICDDDSMYDFVARRFGEDVAMYAIDPLARGICAGDARQLSAASFVAGPLFRMEQEHGGVFRGMAAQWWKREKKVENEKSDDGMGELVRRATEEKWSVWSLEGGLETLVSTLADDLRRDGVQIMTDAAVSEVQRDSSSGSVTVVVKNGSLFSADHVFLASPAFSTAKIFQQSSRRSSSNTDLPPGDSGVVASHLRDIPFVTVAVVTIEFDRKVTDLQAFGFLVPSNQPEPLLGAIFDSCAFPQGTRDVFTVMMGGSWFGQHFGAHTDEDAIAGCAVRELRRILSIDRDPSRVVVKIQRDCIAQYTVGHRQRVDAARSEIAKQGLAASLVGSSYDGVGINDTIMSAKREVENMRH